MNFAFRSLSEQGFDEWVAKAKAGGTPLDREAYLKLEKPSEAEPVRYYGPWRTASSKPSWACASRRARCASARCTTSTGWAARHRKARRTAAAAITTIAAYGAATSPQAPPSRHRDGRPRGDVQPEGMMPRDQERARGGVNEPQTAPDQGQGDTLPGADRAPAPAQLNTQPSPQRHPH